MHKQIREEVAELVFQASQVRALSRTFTEQNTVRDLQNFAAALEHEASELSSETGEFRSPTRRAQ